MTPNKSDQKPKSYRMNRRRLLQMTGVGVGTLTMTAVGGHSYRTEHVRERSVRANIRSRDDQHLESRQ